MNKFYLSKKVPHFGERKINHVFCKDRKEAIDYFNEHGYIMHEPVRLNSEGIQKKKEIVYVVSEPFEIGHK